VPRVGPDTRSPRWGPTPSVPGFAVAEGSHARRLVSLRSLAGPQALMPPAPMALTI
jgi:hypothetical protein